LSDVEYDTIEKRWYDVGIFFPKKWNIDDGEPIYDVWPTTPNLPIQFWYNAAESLQFQFDDPYFETTESIITSEPILTQIGETYTIEVIGNDNLETEGWYYSINGASFNFTTDTIQTRSFSVSQTISITVQGTGGYEYSASINLIVPWYQILEPTGGTWDGLYQYYFMEKTVGGRYAYSLVDDGTTNVVDTTHNVEYDPADTKWYSAGAGTPVSYEDIDGGGIPTIELFPTLANLENQYWYDDGNVLRFQFVNPYYVPAAFFDFLYITATNNSLEVEMDVTNVSSGWTGTLYNQTTLETITTPETFVDTTLNYADLSNGDWVFTATASDGVEYISNTVNINYTASEPGYTYLAFYGRSGASNGWFYELELTTTDGVIDYTNPVPLNKITVVGTILGSDPRWNNPSCIFDGQYTQPAAEALIFEPNEIGVLFYMENSSRIEVQSGSYYTYDSEGSSAVLSGAIYGTNTDPTTFDATDEANWDYVCDLTIISETPDTPPFPVPRLVPTGGDWQGTYDYYYFETSAAGRYLYDLVPQGTDTKYQPGNAFAFEYDPYDGKFMMLVMRYPINGVKMTQVRPY